MFCSSCPMCGPLCFSAIDKESKTHQYMLFSMTTISPMLTLEVCSLFYFVSVGTLSSGEGASQLMPGTDQAKIKHCINQAVLHHTDTHFSVVHLSLLHAFLFDIHLVNGTHSGITLLSADLSIMWWDSIFFDLMRQKKTSSALRILLKLAGDLLLRHG